MEIVREAHERFTKTGQPIWERIDADTEVFDHDIPDARNPYRGVDGVTDWLSTLPRLGTATGWRSSV